MRVEWPTVLLIAAMYSAWIAAGAWLWPLAPPLALLLMTMAAALHSSLVHECLHGHPTRSRRLNEAFVTVNPSLLYPYRRYRATHLAHHADERLTDPFEDPESWYMAHWRWRRLPGWFRAVLEANNTLLGRVLLGPWLGGAGFLMNEARLLRADARGVRVAWALHALSLLPVLAALAWFGIPLWLYVLTVVWGSFAIISVRTFAEHRWHGAPEGRTIIVERSPLGLLFLNNNLHIVHHKLPAVAWYRLPAIYRADRPRWQALNHGYVFPNYAALWRAHGLRRKEPVAHPAWRREP